MKMNRRNLQRRKQKQDSVLRQMILACPLCGAPNGGCLPEPHRKGVSIMSKSRAATLAINFAFQDEPDYKTRATGER